MQENEKVNKRGISLQAKQARGGTTRTALIPHVPVCALVDSSLLLSMGTDEMAAQILAQAAGAYHDLLFAIFPSKEDVVLECLPIAPVS